MKESMFFPPEWHEVESVLIAWPHSDTDWAPLLHEVRCCYGNIIDALSARCKVLVIGPEEPDKKYIPKTADKDNILYIPIDTNDTWTRDYGPISLIGKEGRVLKDFCFNGWGLKFAADKDNLTTMSLCDMKIINGYRSNCLSFVLEGGSIETDGLGTILTTESCLLNPNRNGGLGKTEIENTLKKELAANRILWLKNGWLEGDDTDGHIDTLARIVSPDKIIYTGCADRQDSHFESMQAMKKELESLTTVSGKPFNLFELPLPEAMYDPEDGSRLPATYANFLIVNGAVLVPVYGNDKLDAEAIAVIEKAMPEYMVVPILCSALVRQHGSLHCATMQIPNCNDL